jgi:hypothetical protein
MEKFFGCAIEFGADTDEIIFQDTVGHLHLVGADPYLSKILIQNCDQALAHRRPQRQLATSHNRERNNFTPCLHGKARLAARCEGAGHEQSYAKREKWSAEELSFSKILNQLTLRSRHALFE